MFLRRIVLLSALISQAHALSIEQFIEDCTSRKESDDFSYCAGMLLGAREAAQVLLEGRGYFSEIDTSVIDNEKDCRNSLAPTLGQNDDFFQVAVVQLLGEEVLRSTVDFGEVMWAAANTHCYLQLPFELKLKRPRP